MRQTKFRKRLIAVVGALMMLGSALAYALPSYEIEKTFYSGPDKEFEVGGSILTCYGNFIRWGKTTQWADIVTTPCPN
jgi:hypothetical protein